MAYRSIETSETFAAEPAEIWRLLVDPRIQLEDHPVTIEGPASFVGAVGERWVEQHGPECDDDRVEWTVIEAEFPTRYRMRGRQRGITQTSGYTLQAVDGGTLVIDRLVFGASFAGRFPQQLLPWALLATGLLPRILEGEGEVFSGIERELAKR
ncbi:SRPBCC family protein [Plantibacter sp. Mn2098]|uniref:SRPBCC family protein n=1 Tax=Plantibacter sp. Mn2098 TaxID=3395266 RepID=UPI003BD6DA43